MSEKEMTGNLFFLANRQTKNAQAAAPVKRETILVERICAGETEAFDELYKMFAPMVHGIILARVRRDEADDLVQEVFIQAYKNINSLRDREKVGGWLAMIARNRAAEFYRQFKPTEELSEDLKAGKNLKTEAAEILTTIRSLPDAYCETLILRLVEGLTGVEIADQTGLTPESVRVNLHRGMKLLKEKLGVGE